MKKFVEHERILTNEEAIKEYCPNARTVEEVCEGDEVKIAAMCKALGCNRYEKLITPDEAKVLIAHAPVCKNKRDVFTKAMDDIKRHNSK